MRPLHRKLLRDLWRMRGQVVAVAVVVASGVAVLIMAIGVLDSLRDTASAYYERYRFAEVFGALTRAPLRIRDRVREVPGVQSVDVRIAEFAVLDVPGFREPVMGQLISISESRQPVLNQLVLRSGRWVRRGRPDEAILHEPFAEAHGLKPGDRLFSVINGRRRRLEVVGTALSPEFVYAIGPGALMPDEKRFGIVWMGQQALAAAFDLDGAFNTYSLTLEYRADPAEVILRVDALLSRYGGTGAYERSRQVSHWFLSNEMDQLRNLATILPAIFAAVAAFLTSMVLRRTIAMERAEIGLLRAFGYSAGAVGWHYLEFVIVVVVLGTLLGWGVGIWFGRVTTAMYSDFFHFPFFFFRPRPPVFAVSAAIGLMAAGLGALHAIRAAVALSPAEAMRPPAPVIYRRRGPVDRWAGAFDLPTRMMLRHLIRWPIRSAAVSLGVAFAVALLVAAFQWLDAIERLAEKHFFEAQRQDATLGLVDVQSREILREFERLPGVFHAEPLRTLPARLRAGPRSRRETLVGVPRDARLQPPTDVATGPKPPPPEGLLLGSELARVLGVTRGDSLQVDILEGRRPTLTVPVVDLLETYIGTPAYADLAAVNRWMREAPSINAAHLAIDPAAQPELFARLKKLPELSAVSLRRAALDQFYGTLGETVLIFISFYGGLAGALAFGVTYNSVRINLSERARDLATLRVLGFSRAEISYILLGESALLILGSLPLGAALGYGLAWLLAERFSTELFRVPIWVEPSTLGGAALAAMGACAISAAIVRRRIDRLDLIATLKTRE